MVDSLKVKNKTVGFKQSIRAIQADNVKIVYLSKDSDSKIRDTICGLCEKYSVEIDYMDTMKQLGKACGIDVGASVVCLLKG